MEDFESGVDLINDHYGISRSFSFASPSELSVEILYLLLKICRPVCD